MRAILIASCFFTALVATLLPQQVLSQTVTIRNGVSVPSNPAKAIQGIQVRFPRQAKRVGQASWVLFEAANAEIHVFVEADPNRQIKRMYMVQFESLLASNKDFTYPIPNQPIVNLGGREFYVRANAGKRTDPIQPGSEFEQVSQLLVKKGYVLPIEFGSVRLLSYPSAERRDEIIILYWEDLAELNGLYNGDFESLIDRAARAYSATWTPIGEALKRRALERIRVITR
jgi:hypothetical protein